MALPRTLASCALALAALVVLSACGQRNAPPADERTAPAGGAEPAVAARGHPEGAPRITNGAAGVHIEYRLYGRGDPALVFVHGGACDSNYWRAQIDEFRKKYTVLTVDLAGHGVSAKNRSDWSIASFGEDVAAAVREIPTKNIVLIGHSLGGPVALEAAKLLKSRVIGIIGVDTFKRLGLPPPPAAYTEARLAQMSADFIGYTRNFVAKNFFTKNADTALKNKIVHDMSLAPPEVAAGGRAAAG